MSIIEKIELVLDRIAQECVKKLSRAEADALYLAVDGKAESAKAADTATSAVNAVSASVADMASKDAEGNVITETYAKKSEVSGLPDIVDLGSITD